MKLDIWDKVNIASAGVVVIAALSLPLLSLPDTTPLSDDVISLSDEGDTNTHVVRDSAGTVLSVEPGAQPTNILYLNSLPPCDHEDGTTYVNGVIAPSCVWDAAKRGIGDSFIVFAK